MKHFKIVFIIVLLISISNHSFSQTVNFNNLKTTDRHLVTLHTGLDYGLVFGGGYAYQLKSKKPIFLNIDLSLPSGENTFDDFKTKIGGQMNYYQSKHFHFSAKVQGIFRQNENDYVRLRNFGTEVSGTFGYYKSKWFAAMEIGFDKAIVTHFKHSSIYKQIYPSVQDGWYEPATGGNFNFGLLVGYSFKSSDLFLKAGKVSTQNFSNPTLPFYAQLGYTIRFRASVKRL